MKFSAVILAGGQSRRMGRDKAWLPLDGQTRLARQLDLVRPLAPAEIVISGRAGADYSAFGCPVLTDRFTDAGSLAGIESALAAATAPLVMVLAVDLPRMSREFLRNLLAQSSAGLGVVSRHNPHCEPLAAVYPTSAQPVAEALLARGVRAARQFAAQCEEAGLIRFLDVVTEALPCFDNWNTPEDVPPRPVADETPARC